MAQLFDIKKVTIGTRALVARVELAPGAPLMTGDDPEGTARVLGLMPGLADHVCLGDSSSSFGEVVEDTELAHLLEHVTVELLAQTDAAGDISTGQTVAAGERSYEITLSCPDDVLVAGALSSAAWILQWAYSGGGEPEPDVTAIAKGLVNLVEGLAAQEAEKDADAAAEAASDEAAAESAEAEPVAEAESDDATAENAEPEAEGSSDEGAQAAAEDAPAEDVPVGATRPFVVTDAAAPAAAAESSEEAPVSAPAEEAPAADAAGEGVGAGAAADGGAAEDAAPSAPAGPTLWDMDNVPRPHLVR